VNGEAVNEKRLHRLRRVEVSHRLRSMRKVPSSIPTASAAGHDGLGHRATRGSPTASVVGGPSPPFFLGRRAAFEGTAQAGASKRRTPTNLFATYFEDPGNRVGETGRMDGNGRKATTAVMRNGC
jgi:hypothetical protein